MLLSDKIKNTIRNIQDYPKPGITFKDITPVLADAGLVREMMQQLIKDYKGQKIDAIASTEARGFIFGSVLAYELGCPFVPVRKTGKLPYQTLSRTYNLEYGTATIEMHTDAIKPGWRVLVHDDLLATGGTAVATAELIQEAGGIVAGFSFIINLSFLPGEKNLEDHFGVKPHYLASY
ncbi:adenine phosphoribosyltransferase [Chryseolinea lacunae]|uniref:Adenine phosphoribosyltransferase n=1 Tax=Chryseolinea lacunae TaxID=2801331 RepID=A0ABS1KLA7_9BACT|nr:adenine phosphoribosyltransferase [Chryseolinea lacunae]MBL0740119.1 adenine phosphoribosyltransferase [Chryseolinea lacunae]